VAETKRKIQLHFLAHLRLNLVLGSAKRLSYGRSQKWGMLIDWVYTRCQHDPILHRNSHDAMYGKPNTRHIIKIIIVIIIKCH